MPNKTWNLNLDGRQHTVELDHGMHSGKLVIVADGMIAVKTRKLIDFGSEHDFYLGGHKCTIRVRPNWANMFLNRWAGPGGYYHYECLIDGAPSGTPAQQAEEEMKQALSMIQQAWMGGAFIAGVTLLLVAVGGLVGAPLLGFDLWSLIDVEIVGALTYGVYRRNRAAAILLFGYFVLNEASLWLDPFASKTLGGAQAVYAFTFAALLFQGVKGTFAYRKLMKREQVVYATH